MTNEISLHLPVLADGEDKSSSIKNRIRKNTRHIRKWAKRSNTDCFRIYDRDIKEYPIAIDFYAGRFCVHFFSYDRDRDEPSPEFKKEIDQILGDLFEVKPALIYWKTRIKRKKTQQYEKIDEKAHFFTALEYGVKFWINLEDYLDTGLFLDHRETRRMVATFAKGKKLLNLFAYTCSFSIQAAHAGALFTKSVDLSNTYTYWGKENFLLNNLSLGANQIVRADCLKFLLEEAATTNKYDLIVIDPPTLSRSKKMEQLFDIQIEYPFLIKQALKLLSLNGIIFFSTNFRKFQFDETLFPECGIKEISEKTLPLDFHNKKIHRCWKIQQK